MPTRSSATQPICRSGHIQPQRGNKFCAKCGQPTIEKCESCGSAINGAHIDSGQFSPMPESKRPAYCEDCGKPFPWTRP